MDVPTLATKVNAARLEIRRRMEERYERRIRSAAGVSASLTWEEAQRVIRRLDPAERAAILAECWEWHDQQIAALDEAAKKRGYSG